MADFRLAASAEAALDDILLWSQRTFGPQARQRYAALLVTAMQDVAEQPNRTNVSWKRLKSGPIGVYHVGHSKAHAPDPPGPVAEPRHYPGPVAEPRHYVVFRIASDGIVEILGFVHERMLLPRAVQRLGRQ